MGSGTDGVLLTERIWRETGLQGEKVSLVFEHVRFSTSKIFKQRLTGRNVLWKHKG